MTTYDHRRMYVLNYGIIIHDEKRERKTMSFSLVPALFSHIMEMTNYCAFLTVQRALHILRYLNIKAKSHLFNLCYEL